MADEDWSVQFFDEDNIVSTLQHLLHRTGRSVEDLCQLCFVAEQCPLVFALTLEGLVPFANHSEYLFPYAKMNRRQLQTLCAQSKSLTVEDSMRAVYIDDFYIVRVTTKLGKVDSVLMIFAAACILARGLGQCIVHTRGIESRGLDSDTLKYHVNATLSKIVRSCLLKTGVHQAAMLLLQRHQVGLE